MRVADQFSNLWIIKGNKDNILFDDRDGDIVDHMHTCIDHSRRFEKRMSNWWIQRRKEIPSAFGENQIALAWRSRQKIGIVGIGKIIDVKPFGYDRKIEDYYPERNEHWFNWDPKLCFCEKCTDSYISIDQIKAEFKTEKTPIFLLPSVVQTVYPVTNSQAEVLEALIARKLEPLTRSTAKDLFEMADAHSRSS